MVKIATIKKNYYPFSHIKILSQNGPKQNPPLAEARGGGVSIFKVIIDKIIVKR